MSFDFGPHGTLKADINRSFRSLGMARRLSAAEGDRIPLGRRCKNKDVVGLLNESLTELDLRSGLYRQ